MSKKELPALPVKNALARFRQFAELAIPPEFKGTTDLVRSTEAYQAYENSDHAGQTLSEILVGYSNKYFKRVTKGEEDNALRVEEKLLPLHRARLEQSLNRNTLETYRISKGLDKVREQLIEGLLSKISFQEGLEKLGRYIDEKPNKKILTALQGSLDGLLTPPEDLSLQQKVQRCFPDITAEEVAWLSITNVERSGIIYALDAPFFYPGTLVEMDIDGLQFAFGTIDEALEYGSKALHKYQLVGASGVSNQYHLVPFEHQIAQAIKAIVLLSINDDDLFRRIWMEQKDTPIRRGDATLVKAFLKAENTNPNIDWDENLQDLLYGNLISRSDIDKARIAIEAYAQSKLQLIDSPVKTPLDFLKLVGLLERIPEFIQQQRPFKGYVKLYGTSVEFINTWGVIEDSVPLHEHLFLTTSYQFHDQLADISQRNLVAEKLFCRLKRAVYNEVLSADSRMAPDIHQGNIFENWQIFIPVSVKKQTRQYTALEMLRAHLIQDVIVERTLKFSNYELRTISDIFACLPRKALANVRSVVKEISHAATLASLRSGSVKAASYNPENKQITICLPISTPATKNGLDAFVDIIMSAPGQRKEASNRAQDCLLHQSYFKHALLHEVGESLWASMPPKLRKAWGDLTPKEVPTEASNQFFLTPYSKEDTNEDFCECFAIYLTHGMVFRARGETHLALKLKYEFIKKIWEADGESREFEAELEDLPLAFIHGRPEDNLGKIELEAMLRDELATDAWNSVHERAAFAKEVLSYETLKERALQNEQAKNPIQHAARNYDLQEELDHQQELARKKRVARLVTLKTEQALYALKLDPLQIDLKFYSYLAHGQKQKAVEVLRIANAKPKRDIDKTVNRLIRLHEFFEEDLALTEEEKQNLAETSEWTEQIGKRMEALVRLQKEEEEEEEASKKKNKKNE